jgi:hypothetical protein
MIVNPKWADNKGAAAVDFNTAVRKGWDTTDTEVLKRIGKELGLAVGHGANFTHFDCRTYLTPLPPVDFYYKPDPRAK